MSYIAIKFLLSFLVLSFVFGASSKEVYKRPGKNKQAKRLAIISGWCNVGVIISIICLIWSF